MTELFCFVFFRYSPTWEN